MRLRLTKVNVMASKLFNAQIFLSDFQSTSYGLKAYYWVGASRASAVPLKPPNSASGPRFFFKSATSQN